MTSNRGRSRAALCCLQGFLVVALVFLANPSTILLRNTVEAFGVVSKHQASFLHSRCSSFSLPTLSQQQQQQQQDGALHSTSASAAYLESISYQPPSIEDGLLGATSKYLDALSSVSYQALAPATTPAHYTTAASTSYNTPFSEDQLVNEVVQRVTEEFSSTLDAFGGDTYDSFFESASEFLASATTPYMLDLDDDTDLVETTKRKGSKALRDSFGKANESSNTEQHTAANNNNNPEETLRELSSKLDNTFRSFRENLSSSTHSAKSTIADSVRKETAQPNAAVTTAKQQQNLDVVIQKIDEGALTPEAITTNAREAVDTVAKEAATILSEQQQLQQPLGNAASNANEAARHISETTTAAMGGVTTSAGRIQESFGSLVTNTNRGIEKAIGAISETTQAATSSIAETTQAATSSIAQTTGSVFESGYAATNSVFETTNAATSSAVGAFQAASSQSVQSIASGASAAASTIQAVSSQSIQSVASGVASGVGQTASTARDSVGAVKAAVVTAQPGTAATSGKISAVTMSAAQGFGMPGNAYGGGGDLAGMIEMVAATVVAVPRAVADVALVETNHPTAMDDMMEEISTSLYRDLLAPLSVPLQEVVSGSGEATAAAVAQQTAATATTAIATTPLDQAQAVLKTLQMVLALVVGIPRAALEGLTGQTIDEIQNGVSETDVAALSEMLAGFASSVSALLLSLLKVVAQAVSVVVAKASAATATGTSVAASASTAASVASAASTTEDLVPSIVSFVLEDVLPTIVDGLLIVLQQFAVLLLEGGSAVVSAL